MRVATPTDVSFHTETSFSHTQFLEKRNVLLAKRASVGIIQLLSPCFPAIQLSNRKCRSTKTPTIHSWSLVHNRKFRRATRLLTHTTGHREIRTISRWLLRVQSPCSSFEEKKHSQYDETDTEYSTERCPCYNARAQAILRRRDRMR